MKIRFQADADLKVAIVSGVLRRAAAVDFRRAEAAPLEGLGDPEVLAEAASDGRVLVSHDVNTMSWHFRQFVQKQFSPGLVLIPQTRVKHLTIDRKPDCRSRRCAFCCRRRARMPCGGSA